MRRLPFAQTHTFHICWDYRDHDIEDVHEEENFKYKDHDGETDTFGPEVSLLYLLQVLALVQPKLDHILEQLAVLLLRRESHPLQHLQTLVHFKTDAGVEEEKN